MIVVEIRTDYPLHMGSLPRGARCRQHFMDAHVSHLLSKVIAEDRIALTAIGVMGVSPTQTTLGLLDSRFLGMAILPGRALGLRSGLPALRRVPFLSPLHCLDAFLFFRGRSRMWNDAETWW